MPLYVYVCHFSPDFASLNYSMRRLRVSNKNIPRNLVGKSGYGPERLILSCVLEFCEDLVIKPRGVGFQTIPIRY